MAKGPALGAVPLVLSLDAGNFSFLYRLCFSIEIAAAVRRTHTNQLLGGSTRQDGAAKSICGSNCGTDRWQGLLTSAFLASSSACAASKRSRASSFAVSVLLASPLQSCDRSYPARAQVSGWGRRRTSTQTATSAAPLETLKVAPATLWTVHQNHCAAPALPTRA